MVVGPVTPPPRTAWPARYPGTHHRCWCRLIFFGAVFWLFPQNCFPPPAHSWMASMWWMPRLASTIAQCSPTQAKSGSGAKAVKDVLASARKTTRQAHMRGRPSSVVGVLLRLSTPLPPPPPPPPPALLPSHSCRTYLAILQLLVVTVLSRLPVAPATTHTILVKLPPPPRLALSPSPAEISLPHPLSKL